jgi:hypothetical protein
VVCVCTNHQIRFTPTPLSHSHSHRFLAAYRINLRQLLPAIRFYSSPAFSCVGSGVRGNRYYRGRDAQQRNIIHRRNNLLVYTLVGENTNKGGGQKIVGL